MGRIAFILVGIGILSALGIAAYRELGQRPDAASAAANVKSQDVTTKPARDQGNYSVFDFGTVELGQELKHSFPIVNKSDSAAKVVITSTSCSCTQAKLSKDNLVPGETGEVTLTLRPDAGGYRSGSVTVRIGQVQDVKCEVRAVIKGGIQVQPATVDFGRYHAGDRIERFVDVAFTPGDETTVKFISLEVPTLPIKFREVKPKATKVGQAGGIIFRAFFELIVPTPPPDYLNGSITLAFERDGESRKIDVKARGKLDIGYELTPANVFLDCRHTGQESAENQLRLQFEKADNAIASVKVEPNAVAVRYSAEGSGVFKIAVKPQPDSVTGGIRRGTIHIVTTDPSLPDLRIPFTVIGRSLATTSSASVE